MEFTELSLGQYGKSSGERETNNLPRKWIAEAPPSTVDLQLQHPLPSDWEQCLDLQTGRMYYVNRKTLRKSWNRPQEDDQHKLDLELNISTGCSSNTSTSNMMQRLDSSMVALACSNCHLLVILSRSSPSCPNCKYVHSLGTRPL
ncbi:Ubiquitin--protein ligase [Handroanthus impetiginosus]|uniref:Ubiquitin--protein ligase n=1 Tax=Handroanthus impetiginosus TaxID=429701 RepID=A0A2G9HK02_9LAMI|nr:Ubiquitin--protein ligase [Handroanthus impetiginosus]